MTEKELFGQLNKIKNIKPDLAWQKKNRDILLNQIFASEEISKSVFDWSFFVKQSLLAPMLRNLKTVSQPAIAVVLICAFIFSGGILSLRAARETKPGDSLYIAKIISEKTQLAFTFNEKGKARLGIEFAGNRAKEISQVLAEPNDNNKDDRVGKLVSNFKDEIKAAKNRITKIKPETQVKEVALNNAANKNEILNGTEEEAIPVFSAAANKDQNGLQIAEQNSLGDNQTVPGGGITADNIVKDQTGSVDNTNSSSSTLMNSAVNNQLKASSDPQIILQQAEELLDKEDYGATIKKLEEANTEISKIEGGQVKGESEYATSTVADTNKDADDSASSTDNN